MKKLNRETTKKFDRENMLGSIEFLDRQIEEVWNLSKKMSVPASYKKIKNVVVAGMGGSALPIRIIKSVFRDQIKVPVEIVNDYTLPAFANRDTLVVLSSYSGSTEEILNVAAECKKKKIKCFAITSGKNLANSVKNGLPGFIFSTNNNPCGSPRMGLGYNLFSHVILFSKLGLIKLTEKEIRDIIVAVQKYSFIYGVEADNNLVKQAAMVLKDKIVFFMAAEHLIGNAHVAANQMNENSKRMAVSFPVPELNHHLMEGMRLPSINQKNILAIIFNSGLYSQPLQNRLEITKEILSQNKIQWFEYGLAEGTKLNQIGEALVFSSYLSFYGAILAGIDPTALPFVDYFKKKLKK